MYIAYCHCQSCIPSLRQLALLKVRQLATSLHWKATCTEAGAVLWNSLRTTADTAFCREKQTKHSLTCLPPERYVFLYIRLSQTIHTLPEARKHLNAAIFDLSADQETGLV